VQDVEPERFLKPLPGRTLRVEDDPNEAAEDKYYNLAQYDLVVMYDPDWSEFTGEQLALLQKWVDSQGGRTGPRGRAGQHVSTRAATTAPAGSSR